MKSTPGKTENRKNKKIVLLHWKEAKIIVQFYLDIITVESDSLQSLYENCLNSKLGYWKYLSRMCWLKYLGVRSANVCILKTCQKQDELMDDGWICGNENI